MREGIGFASYPGWSLTDARAGSAQRVAGGPGAEPLRTAAVSFRHEGSDALSLEEVSLAVGRGEFLLVAGRSGCGKTTLAHALTGFIPHYFRGHLDGQVYIEGVGTTHSTIPELAQHVGLVQQDPEGQLCTLRVEDEVAFGPENLALSEPEVRQRVAWALETVGAAHLAGRSTASLSGGEKQRVALASILAMGPHTLILDEPTSGLDPAGARDVFAALGEMRRQGQHTLVVIEHRIRRLLPLATGVARMDGGRLAMVSAEALAEGLAAPRADAGPPPVDRSSDPLLEVTGLSVRRQGDTAGPELLRDLSLRLWPGEVVCLMGDNGSGKTTLLKSLVGLLPPVRPFRMRVGRDDLSGDKPARRAKKVGLLFQNPNHQLFGRTVLEAALMPANNLCPDSRGAHERAMKLLDSFGLADRAQASPVALSHGQKKRLALASVLAYAPDVLLLDEPFAGQDDLFAAQVMQAVSEHCCARGGTALIVAHDPELAAAHSHRLLFLDGGEVVIDAPPERAFSELRAAGRPEYCPV